MAIKKRFPYKAAFVACNGGCRATADCQYGCVGCELCVNVCKFDEDLDNIDDYLMDDDDDEYDDYDEDDDYEDADEDDDQNEYDFGSETLYEVKCPSCGEVITIDEEMLDEGATTCPNCGEELEFDMEDEEPEEDQ